MVRIDKALSELWDLKKNPSSFTNDQLKEVATMAINALHEQEEEHEKFVDASYEAIKKEEEKAEQLQKYQKALEEQRELYEALRRDNKRLADSIHLLL